jgi:hypothetical protein
MSPRIVTRAFAQPKSSPGALCAGSIGASFARGLPCLVIVISSPEAFHSLQVVDPQCDFTECLYCRPAFHITDCITALYGNRGNRC